MIINVTTFDVLQTTNDSNPSDWAADVKVEDSQHFIYIGILLWRIVRFFSQRISPCTSITSLAIPVSMGVDARLYRLPPRSPRIRWERQTEGCMKIVVAAQYCER
jgi:hypothetical protein